MRLHFAVPSPYARKVLVAAHELGLADRIETVAQTVAPVTPNDAYAHVNPLVKVPALELDDGEVLYDSIVICEYLDDLAGGNRLFPRSPDLRWRNLRLHALADGVLDAALLWRYETVLRPEPLRWTEWIDGQSRKIHNALDEVERHPEWLAPPAMGPFALGCALGYLDFRFPQLPWREGRDALARWFGGIEQRPSFQATRPN